MEANSQERSDEDSDYVPPAGTSPNIPDASALALVDKNPEPSVVPVLVPANLEQVEPMDWTSNNVKEFVRWNQEGHEISDATITTTCKAGMVGITFMALTTQKLMAHPFRLEYGAAQGIQNLVTGLKQVTNGLLFPLAEAN